MNVFSQRSLKFKLISGFAIFALVSLLITGLSNWTVEDLNQEIEKIGNEELTGIVQIMVMDKSLVDLSRKMTTFLNPLEDRQDRERAQSEILQLRQTYRSTAETYQTALRNAEEHSQYDAFQASVRPWADANNRIMKLNEELMQLDILNPSALLHQLETFRADHYALMTRAARHLATGELLHQGHDPRSCRYDTWQTAYSGSNPTILAAIEKSHTSHDSFHKQVALINQLIEQAAPYEARQAALQTLITEGEAVIEHFAAIRKEVERSEAIYNEMSRIHHEEAAN